MQFAKAGDILRLQIVGILTLFAKSGKYGGQQRRLVIMIGNRPAFGGDRRVSARDLAQALRRTFTRSG